MKKVSQFASLLILVASHAQASSLTRFSSALPRAGQNVSMAQIRPQTPSSQIRFASQRSTSKMPQQQTRWFSQKPEQKNVIQQLEELKNSPKLYRTIEQQRQFVKQQRKQESTSWIETGLSELSEEYEDYNNFVKKEPTSQEILKELEKIFKTHLLFSTDPFKIMVLSEIVIEKILKKEISGTQIIFMAQQAITLIDQQLQKISKNKWSDYSSAIKLGVWEDAFFRILDSFTNYERTIDESMFYIFTHVGAAGLVRKADKDQLTNMKMALEILIKGAQAATRLIEEKNNPAITQNEYTDID